MGVWTGTLPTIVAFSKILGSDVDTLVDAVAAVTDPWTSYSPSWTASVAPAVGNGSLSGSYLQAGHLVIATVALSIGSTTTFGTGAWNFSLPVAAATSGMHIGTALLWDVSTDTNKRAGAVFLTSTTTVVIVGDGSVAALVPFTWANGDVLRFSITYEAA